MLWSMMEVAAVVNRADGGEYRSALSSQTEHSAEDMLLITPDHA